MTRLSILFGRMQVERILLPLVQTIYDFGRLKVKKCIHTKTIAENLQITILHISSHVL
jgi:hypothetical protein